MNEEKQEQAKNIEKVEKRLDRAEGLVFRFGTPKAIKQGTPVRTVGRAEHLPEQQRSYNNNEGNESI